MGLRFSREGRPRLGASVDVLARYRARGEPPTAQFAVTFEYNTTSPSQRLPGLVTPGLKADGPALHPHTIAHLEALIP